MPILGEIRMFAGNFAPRGWAMCSGQLLPISQNDALYSLIGTTYGGDGTNTFGLPDFRGRAPMNAGQGPGLSSYVLGQPAGSESVTLLVAQMAAHNHMIRLQCNKNAAATTLLDPTNAYPGATGSGTPYANLADAGMGTAPNSSGLTGGNQPHDNMQPYLAVTFIIATEGIYPARN